jgi:hypothetical protein
MEKKNAKGEEQQTAILRKKIQCTAQKIND